MDASQPRRAVRWKIPKRSACRTARHLLLKTEPVLFATGPVSTPQESEAAMRCNPRKRRMIDGKGRIEKKAQALL
jgi:hypothetical protein